MQVRADNRYNMKVLTLRMYAIHSSSIVRAHLCYMFKLISVQSFMRTN